MILLIKNVEGYFHDGHGFVLYLFNFLVINCFYLKLSLLWYVDL